ncbi:hypothetical protein P3X46_030291 [Hevea brasiliensis]|uniref:Uncharacterized protein n=1 Tax=Hevea brasiliensis TaxID=3981 RepID=A0ABQ9KGT3_HEVBR|nr:uncharacterized protein LOC110671349 [Hevea brasiliensis]KAJ9139566.1 hypothetical protein P3X46_030291 [Hevea brasiliensis]
MDRLSRGSAILILCFFSIVVSSVGDGHKDQEKRPALSFPETLARTYWDWAKTIVHRAQAYFFPPNIDFRGSNGAGEQTDMGAGEKVKEAVAESLGKTRATVEDSAKSAAKVASETVHKTKEKVKRSLSDQGRQETDHSEL